MGKKTQDVDLEPLGVPIKLAQERQNWRAAFTPLMVARQLCEMDKEGLEGLSRSAKLAGTSVDKMMEPIEWAIDFVEVVHSLLENGRKRLLFAKSGTSA